MAELHGTKLPSSPPQQSVGTSVATRSVLGVILAALIGCAAFLLSAGIPLSARYASAIFAITITLWVTEAIPLFATSLVIAFLQIVLLGLEGGPLGYSSAQYRVFLQPFFDPAVVLMLGGIVLGAALAKHKLDVTFAALVLKLLPNTPAAVLAGFMGVTAFLSMWMSNTASTVLMLAILMPALRQIPEDKQLQSALVLGITFAANVGGMATPIGTPPNAIALGALNRVGLHIGFLEWMGLALPLVLVLLGATWFLLMRVFPPSSKELHVTFGGVSKPQNEGLVILLILVATMGLWLTTDLHGIPEAVIALLPMIVLFGSRILSKADLKSLDWDVLLIIGGGMSLSAGFQASGLSDVLVGLINTGNLPAWQLILLVATVSVLLSTVINHTAATSLLMPLVISIGGPVLVPAVVAAALASSVGVGLPISNASNTLVYGTGLVSTKTMAKCGFPLAFLGTALAVMLVTLIQGWLT